jgi:hypothetical protein
MRTEKQEFLFAPRHPEHSLIAAKTISAVEVAPEASNQHEFHAGRLRRHLGFETREIKARLSLLFHIADDTEPIFDETTYTFYDSREKVTTRRSEWRLYYGAESRIQELACEGDLLIIFRPNATNYDLDAIIARHGTKLEKELRRSLALGDGAVIKYFVLATPQPSTQDEAEYLTASLIEPGSPSGAFDVTSNRTYVTAIAEGKIPLTREMAAAAHEIVSATEGLDPDEFLERVLDVESELFFAMERAIGERKLLALLETGLRFDEVLAFAMSIHQARRTRRGQSLQNHLEFLLTRYEIPHCAQCPTEKGEKPDFIIPSREAYADPEYPDEKLRMIGCKSKLRDRWRQYLNEAKRVNPKYHVSLDDGLTGDLIELMHAHGLRLFLPQGIIDRCYAGSPARERIGTIRDLIEDLRTL